MNLMYRFAEAAASTDLTSFLESVKGGLTDFSVTNLGVVIVAGLAIAVAPVLAWFGYRFVKGRASAAFKKGKL